ncbi:MAG: hypothetical protein WCJ45_05590 [bacterium]
MNTETNTETLRKIKMRGVWMTICFVASILSIVLCMVLVYRYGDNNILSYLPLATALVSTWGMLYLQQKTRKSLESFIKKSRK